jgi:hypothetical protein
MGTKINRLSLIIIVQSQDLLTECAVQKENFLSLNNHFNQGGAEKLPASTGYRAPTYVLLKIEMIL